uniref:CSON004232 protein n=1 Tax=Culicoides sonorensis TaxID=179676 RepID=A0A336L4T4_CULSO
MSSDWDKFKLLLRKNFIIQSRSKLQTALEVLIPVAFCSVLIIIRSLVDIKNYDHPIYYKGMEINDLNYIEKINENSNKFNWTIFYSPQNPVLEDFVKAAIERIKTTQKITVEGKKNSSDLNFSLITSKPITGIEFNDILTNVTRIPQNLDFTLRFPYELRNDRSNFVALFNWFTDLIFPQFQENLPRNEKTDDGGLPPGYAREGFLTMQNVISREFIERIQMEGDENFTVPEIFVQRFPYPAYKSDKLLLGLEFLFPVIIINSFLYVCINTVKLLTVEKEKRLKEAMKIMGLSDKLHWFAWFAKSIIFLTITISIITILLKWPIKENVAVFTKSNFTTIWCFLFLYSVTLIMFCFMLSSFFSKSSTGTMAAALLWFLTYMPYPITAEGYDRMSLWIKIVFCLFSNTSMAYGFKLIMRYEGTGFGLQWHNIFKPVTIDDQLTVGYCMVMYILDSVIYGIVTWYIGKINPGEYGVPLKWYFPFTLDYWRGQRRIQADPYFNNIKLSENIEPSPNYLLPGVEIRNLRKVYENSKTAVHGLNMKLFEDEITVLLGHNGAGKTTTMAMLTGMLAPTSGTALMDGLDINKQMNKIRSILGFCPQYDILFDELTVKEHIEFYCKLKGLGPDEIKEEIDKYVDLLELGAKINTPSEQLSGGQKRKLSVCVALCGRSRIVLCDEPTSGMDPSARPLLWFLTYMPYPITAEGYDRMSLWIKIVFCLFSNTSMAYGFKLIMRYEGTGFGLQWHNIFKPVTIDDQLTVGYCMVMFILDSVIYGIVTWYIGKINPGEYGVPLKWYFPFTLEYWRGQRRIQADPYFNNIKLSENIEPSPNYLLPGVEIRNLRKVYENSKTAVHGLNMKLFEDEITVLLGHNGAGKTTTMAMLTGMLAPTSGTALMDGLDINKQMNKIRSILGFCPQYDILFDELTVKEHIEFYCKLKGLGPDEIKEEIDKYVDLLELGAKMNTPSEQLSGGQKRKLSVCVALCGRSRIVLCDEPTSGMDPSARRQLWELLLKEKKSRTILISTHFMDEADVLGDRIAIMSQGELQTMGSPFFLKKKFGVGYRLVCVKTESCNPQKVTELLSSHIPDIYIETDIGSELTYLLKESYISQFKELLEDFENNSKDLGISSFGVTLTTLEEVFLKVMHDDEHASEPKLENIELSVQSQHNSGDSVTSLTQGNYSFHHKQRFLSGFALITNQSKAMFMKKRLYDLRNPIPILIQNIMPIITVILSITDYRKWNQKPDPNSLNVTLGSYGHTVTLIQEDPVFDKRSFERQITHEYVKLALNETAKQEVAVIGTDFQKYLLDLMNSSLPEVNSYYMVASSVTKENVTAWFNNQAFHTAPLSVNLIYNAILKVFCQNCSISVSNHPMPLSSDSKREMLKNGNNVGFNLAFNSGFVFSLAAAFYIMFPIRELATKSKLLQVVSGINSVIYWGCSFIWDYLTFMVTALCYVITIAVFQEEGWSTLSELSRILILFAVFIYAVIPLCYLFAFKFTQPSAGFAKIAMIFILTGLFCFLTVFITAMDIFDLKDTSNTLTWLFLPFPHFAFSHAFNNLNVIQITKQICKSQCQHMGSCDKEFMEKVICTMIPECCDDLNYFQWKSPGVGRNVLFMFLTGTLALILLIGIERGWFKVNRNTGIANQVNNGEEPDTDVLNEKNLVKSLDPSDYFTYNLLLNDLTKYYDKFLAVDHLSLTVKSGQCFGLLGINGAGKTSTFKMLTGDHRISSGDAFVDGLSVKKELNEVYKRIGYCPQFDAVLEDLTGTETLRMYCLLRGFPEQDIPRITKKMARELNFLPHLEKKVKEYSGGNKRKLSTAVALLGDPSVIYLDEPTTGMDPGAKRQFWEIISTIRQEGKTIILTSHSMEEIQALCTRMAIMVNGSFKCLGSAQHLKNKYSRGLILTIKLKRSEMPISVLMDKSQSNDLKEFIIDRFPGAFLREEHKDTLVFYVPKTELRWSKMFGYMENAKKIFNIEDYSLLQTTLEQVFLHFTKYQKGSD